jgi:hypothetical protein
MGHGMGRLCRSRRLPSGHPPLLLGYPYPDSVLVMDADLELELRKMLVERALRRQLFEYHEAMNRADYEALATLLGDAVITVCDAPQHRARSEPLSSLRPEQRTAVIHGGAQFVAGCRATWLTYGGDPRMQFGATNIIVDVADSLDAATCHSSFFLFQALGAGEQPADQEDSAASLEFPLQVISCGRYFDTYRSTGDTWQITARQIYADFAGDASRHMRAPVS